MQTFYSNWTTCSTSFLFPGPLGPFYGLLCKHLLLKFHHASLLIGAQNFISHGSDKALSITIDYISPPIIHNPRYLGLVYLCIIYGSNIQSCI